MKTSNHRTKILGKWVAHDPSTDKVIAKDKSLQKLADRLKGRDYTLSKEFPKNFVYV